MPTSLTRILLLPLVLSTAGIGALGWAQHSPDGPASLRDLREVALYGDDLEERGDAIVALVGHRDPEAAGVLLDIEAHRRAPELVRTWAAAGAVQRVDSLKELGDLSELLSRYPALERPVRLAALELVGGSPDVEALLELSVKNQALSSSFAKIIATADGRELASVMLRHEDDAVRRLAAGHLAAMDDVGREVIALYAYEPGARAIPWKGGALYVPASGWGRREARALTGSLIAWHLHCDRTGLDAEKQQIYNNLRSVGLWRQAGMRSFPNQDTATLLGQWAEVVGVEAVAEMLRDQGVRHDAAYAAALEGR